MQTSTQREITNSTILHPENQHPFGQSGAATSLGDEAE
jgi:hypothetical protein